MKKLFLLMLCVLVSSCAIWHESDHVSALGTFTGTMLNLHHLTIFLH